jgi:hypothetical protein
MLHARVLLFAALLIASPLAKAGLMFEPFVAGGFGNWAMDRTVGFEDMELHGNSVDIAYGARLAWSWRNFFVGGIYQTGSVTWRYEKMESTTTDDGWNLSSKATPVGFGPIVGFKSGDDAYFLWFSWFPSESLKFTSELDPNEAPPIYKGVSNNIGLAVKLSKHANLGVEYQMKRYGKLAQNGAANVELPGPSANGNTFAPLKRNVLYISLTFPFEVY